MLMTLVANINRNSVVTAKKSASRRDGNGNLQQQRRASRNSTVDCRLDAFCGRVDTFRLQIISATVRLARLVVPTVDG